MSDRIEKAGAEHWYHKALALQERAEKAEARVAELEAEVIKLTPPEGYVAVMLPREDVQCYANDYSAFGDGPLGVVRFTTMARVRLNEACRKALEDTDA